MKVILKKQVKDVGPQGAIVDVTDGFARNFLLPKGLAVPVTEKALANIKQQQVVQANREKKQEKATGKMTGQLDGFKLILKESVNENGKLYAAVNAKKIAMVLTKAGFDVTESMIDLTAPCKELGDQLVSIRLPYGFKATIQLIIKKQ
ncbi:50S ribosomal protein L9 [Candidatus Uhrbacteria bacterium RIFOXYA2_FULL_40_9]|nr:MAG: 50S ribosomal protein L9 [Candidatus Uhrbacteria bacterium RIFOXYA2_FULL_40_9]OGL97374.1 MAG: 50S ribosomal protein L9 [Candidatus Uhrbacteria bacterium RIFOXYB2_FULL_41_18]